MEILNADAFDIIDNMQDRSFDLIILDPDYQDWECFIKRGLIEKCMQKLADDGNLITFTKQPFDYDLRIAVNNYFRREIIWSFDNGGAWVSNRMPLVSFQKIFWCVKGKGSFFNPRTGMAYSESTRDFKRTNKVFGGYKEDGREFKKSEEGVWLRDHLHFNKPLTGAIPSKPRELIEIFINCFCKPDGIIFDPFAGSGIIEKVALEKDRDVIAIEKDEERCHAIIDMLMEEGGKPCER